MKHEIYRHLAVLSKPNNGWVKELNFVSWNDREPVYDIRTWTEDHARFGKGVTLTAGEMMLLKKALSEKQVF